MKAINNLSCYYCETYIRNKAYWGKIDRPCSKLGGKVIQPKDGPCKHYRQQKYLFCPEQNKKVTIIECIAYRQSYHPSRPEIFLEHMLCKYFPVEERKSKKKLIKRKKLIRRKKHGQLS